MCNCSLTLSAISLMDQGRERELIDVPFNL